MYIGQVDQCMDRSYSAARGRDGNLQTSCICLQGISDLGLGCCHLATGLEERRTSHREQVLRTSQPSPAVSSCSPHPPLVSPQTLHIRLFGKVRRSPFVRSPFQTSPTTCSPSHLDCLSPDIAPTSSLSSSSIRAWSFLVPHSLMPEELLPHEPRTIYQTRRHHVAPARCEGPSP